MNTRINTVEEMISELEDIAIATIQNQTWREQRLKKHFFFTENSTLQGNFKQANICVIENPKAEEREEKKLKI